jgi:glycosyltransferase involved in cell wall biosynthesis
MRVAYISSSLSRSAGGLYHSVSGLATAVALQGTDITVFGGADRHFEADRGQWGNVPLHSHPLSDVYGFHWRVFRRLLSHRPDLLHLHGIWTATSIYGRLAQLAGIPIVVSPHGMLEAWILRRRALTKAVHGALFERPLVSGGHVHALCAAEYEAVRKYLPGVTSRMFILPNGTAVVAAKHAQARRSGVLYLGRLHPKKQVLELAKAWVQSPLLKGTVLTIAGWGEAGYEAAIRRMAEASINVRFVGSLYGSAKEQAFESAAAFILPSLSEGLPMSVLEALQHGCLPVITDQCNLPELFADGAARRIETDLSDIGRVVADAVATSDDDEQSQFLRSYARRYRWSEIATAMIGHYRAIIDRHPSAQGRT